MSFAKAIFTNQSPYDYWNTPVSEILQKSNDKENKSSYLMCSGGGGGEPPNDPRKNKFYGVGSTGSNNNKNNEKKEDNQEKNNKFDRERFNENNRHFTNKEIKEQAFSLGYTLVKGVLSHGQLVFKKGNKYISHDIDCHRGNFWKMLQFCKSDTFKVIGPADRFLKILKDLNGNVL
jgi:hypothetical protein